MTTRNLDRRSFLKGLGAGAGLLPLVASDLARGATFPTRLVVLFFSNGVIPQKFWPTGGTTDFVLGDILKPIEPYRSRTLVLGGLDETVFLDYYRKADDGSVNPGHGATAGLLTGARYAVNRFQNYQPAGPSIDQYIATELQKRTPTPIHSLVLGGRAGGPSSLSWRGPQDAVTWENDPQKLFARLFAAPTGNSDQALRQRAADTSILDFVASDLTRFGQRLGADDRRKIEAHMASIRDIETELMRAAAAGATCTPPMLRPFAKDASGLQDVTRVQFDLIAAALRCNLTRVVTFKWGGDSDNGTIYPFLGADFSGAIDATDEKGYIRDHHDMGHVAYKNADTLARKARVDQWYFEMVRYLLDRLAETPEGNGTMLDNTAVLVTNNMADGAGHGSKGLPFVLIGSCGGYFKTGRWLKFGSWVKGSSYLDYFGKGTPDATGERYSNTGNFVAGVPHNALLVSLANAMGVPTQSFGDPAYGSGGLPGLTA